MKKIECKYCGWSWNESDGGDDKYMCHMCDNDNSKYYLKESEQPKKGKLFIPRRLSGENSRFIQWNKEQPIVDGVQINQYTHDGKPIGYWDNWVDDDDILVSKGTFVKGKKEGIWEEYLDGELVGKGIYKNGKESGIWEFYEDGEVYRKELFQSGKLVGRWYPSKDTLDESEQSKKGKLFIPRRLSGENSRFIQWNKEQPIVDGERINQYTHDGKKTGIWGEYWDGKLDSKGSYKDDKKEGYWEWYYSNGQLKCKGLYKNDKYDGIWETYYDNGQLMYKISYKDGKYDGIWEEYFENGQLWSKGSYKNDLKNGIWERYYSNGQLISKGLYEDGKYDGIWERYHFNGQLESKVSYENGRLIKELPITESEQSKKGKLFIPRRLSGENSRFIQWNKEQPIVDGERINQYTHDGKPIGYWEEYYDNGQLRFKSLYKDGKQNGIWEYYYSNGQLMSKGLYKNGKLIKELPLTESEQSKKGKLFIPRRIEGRWDDYLKSTITTDYNMDPYLKRRDLYKDNSKNIDPLVMKLSKGDLITFVKANPFWLDSMDKVKYLLNTLNYKENKDIAENHIGQTFAKGNFWTSREMNYYENKFEIPKSNYGKIDIYVFVGSDEFKETRRGSYKKVFDIERLMKVSVDDWKDTKDYGLSHIIKMMRLRASSNNKQLYKISAHKGLLDDYDGETGSEIPDYILMSIDEKKERL